MCHGTTDCDAYWPKWRNNWLSSDNAIAWVEPVIQFEGTLGRTSKAMIVSAWATIIQNFDLLEWAVCCKSTFVRTDDALDMSRLPSLVMRRVLGLEPVTVWGVDDASDFEALVGDLRLKGMRTSHSQSDDFDDSYSTWQSEVKASAGVPLYRFRHLGWPTIIAYDVNDYEWRRVLKRWKNGGGGAKAKTISDLLAVNNLRRASALAYFSNILVHEILHASFGFGHPIAADEAKFDKACDTFYRIANQFLWSLTQRYPELGDSSCLQDLSNDENYDFGSAYHLNRRGWLRGNCS